MDGKLYGDLCDQVMRKCHVSWQDSLTEDRIAGDIMPSARSTLIDLLALPANYSFTKPSIEQMLFLNLCYYMYNDAADEFFANYANELRAARRKWEVKGFAKEAQESTSIY